MLHEAPDVSALEVGDDHVRARLVQPRAIARPVPAAPPVTSAVVPAISTGSRLAFCERLFERFGGARDLARDVAVVVVASPPRARSPACGSARVVCAAARQPGPPAAMPKSARPVPRERATCCPGHRPDDPELNRKNRKWCDADRSVRKERLYQRVDAGHRPRDRRAAGLVRRGRVRQRARSGARGRGGRGAARRAAGRALRGRGRRRRDRRGRRRACSRRSPPSTSWSTTSGSSARCRCSRSTTSSGSATGTST